MSKTRKRKGLNVPTETVRGPRNGVADITYIHTLRNGWCYLASVMDLYTKKIIGYSFSRKMTTDIVVKALEKSIESSFHAILKKEAVYRTQYVTFEQANLAIFQFIEG